MPEASCGTGASSHHSRAHGPHRELFSLILMVFFLACGEAVSDAATLAGWTYHVHRLSSSLEAEGADGDCAELYQARG